MESVLSVSRPEMHFKLAGNFIFKDKLSSASVLFVKEMLYSSLLSRMEGVMEEAEKGD